MKLQRNSDAQTDAMQTFPETLQTLLFPEMESAPQIAKASAAHLDGRHPTLLGSVTLAWEKPEW